MYNRCSISKTFEEGATSAAIQSGPARLGVAAHCAVAQAREAAPAAPVRAGRASAQHCPRETRVLLGRDFPCTEGVTKNKNFPPEQLMCGFENKCTGANSHS